MKFVLNHTETFPPHYDLILGSGGGAETFRIPEDFFFDLVSGSPVEYENAADSGSATASVEDTGEFTRENEKSVILKGEKLNGKLVIDAENRIITLIPV